MELQEQCSSAAKEVAPQQPAVGPQPETKGRWTRWPDGVDWQDGPYPGLRWQLADGRQPVRPEPWRR